VVQDLQKEWDDVKWELRTGIDDCLREAEEIKRQVLIKEMERMARQDSDEKFLAIGTNLICSIVVIISAVLYFKYLVY